MKLNNSQNDSKEPAPINFTLKVIGGIASILIMIILGLFSFFSIEARRIVLSIITEGSVYLLSFTIFSGGLWIYNRIDKQKSSK